MIRPLIVAGAPRSGTTFLMQILNLHPRIAVSYEQNLLGILKLAFRKRWKNAMGSRWLTSRENFSHEDLRNAVFSSEASLEGLLSALYRPIFPDKEWGAPVMWAGDKWNLVDPTEDLTTIVRTGASLIWITRNPLDVVASWSERVTNEGVPGPTGDAALSLWYRSFHIITTAEIRLEAYHLQYEDLLFRPEAVMERLMGWMELAGASSMAKKVKALADPDAFHRRGLTDGMKKKLMVSPVIGEYRMFLKKTGAAPESLASLEE